jgi:hypothetical protein
MERILPIMVVTGFLIAITVGVVFIISSLRGEAVEPPSTTGGTFPNYTSTVGAGGNVEQPNGGGEAVSTGSGATYLSPDGTTVEANDLKKDPELVASPYNEGQYFLGYHYDEETTEEPPYLIEYEEGTQFFYITLLTEPLAETRKTAEQYLMQRLGLNQANLCRLQYMVSVPNRVNSFYAGKSLGFSFCPGATPL